MKTSIKNIKKGKIFSIVLCLLLAVGMIPITSFTTFADGGSGTPQTSKRTVMMGTSAFTDPVAVTTTQGTHYEPTSYVYMEGIDHYTNDHIFKFRVLDSQESNSGDANGIFMMTEGAHISKFVGLFSYKTGVFTNNYSESDAKTIANDKVAANLQNGVQVQNLLLSTGKGSSTDADALYEDYAFLMSAQELSDYVGNYDGAPGLGVSEGSYWLRSPYPDTDQVYVYAMNTNGVKERSHVGMYDTAHYGRFGLNLNKSNVLFAYPANKEKPSISDGLQKVEAYDGKEWQLTMLGSGGWSFYYFLCYLNENQSQIIKPGATIKVDTANNNISSTAGDGWYQSVIIANENNEALYYGRYTDVWSNGRQTHEIKTPDLPEGTYTFYFFVESENSGNEYDLASNLRAIEFKVSEHNWQLSADGDTISAQCTDAGCDATGGTAKITPPADLEYDANDDKDATVTYSNDWKFDKSAPIVYYEKTPNNNYSTVKGTPNGSANVSITYKADFTVDGITASTGDYTIAPPKPTIDGVLVSGYTGTYDGQYHSISVTAPDGVAISYKTADGYTDENPSFKDVGEYTVEYKVTKDGYKDYTGSANVEIEKAQLTVTAKDHTITYGDAPANDGVTYDGFVSNENKDVLSGDLGFDYSYTRYDYVGKYSITPKGLTSGSYEITFVPGKLTVGQKELGISWENTELTYIEGQEQLPNVIAKGIISGDDVSFVIEGAKENAGNDYDATIKGLSGNDAANYKLPNSGLTVKFNINKASPQVTEVNTGNESADSNQPGSSDSVQTGDSNETVLPGALMLMALAGVVIAMRKKDA